jgi:hypothetical protein
MKVFITFGQLHAHRVNKVTFDKDSVAVIKCDSYNHGRKLAFEFFDNKFHNCYDEKDFDPEIMKYFPRGMIKAN